MRVACFPHCNQVPIVQSNLGGGFAVNSKKEIWSRADKRDSRFRRNGSFIRFV